MPKQVKFKFLLTLCVVVLILSAVQTIGTATASYRGGMYVIDDEQNITDHIWSSNGSQIAYLKFPDGKPYWDGELWIADKAEYSAKLRNARQIVLPTGSNVSSIEDWYGDWILFQIRNTELHPTSYYGMNELWKIKSDGTGLTQLTFTGNIYNSDQGQTGASPDGIRYRWHYPAWQNRGTVGYGRFIPGTDGALMYISANNGNGWYKSFTCTTDGSFQWTRISYPNDSFTIDLSPTGNKLLYGDSSGGWDSPTVGLWASNVDGTGKTMIRAYFPHRTVPYVLADGNTIIFKYVHDPPVPATKEGNIYAIDMDGTNERTVLDDEYLNYYENYHPVDGQAMLMRSNRDPDGNWHIFNLNVTSPVTDTSIVQLTNGPYNDVQAMYSPDAHYIMYRRLPDDFDEAANTIPYPYELVIERITEFPTPGFSFISIIMTIPAIILIKRLRKR